jgi:hypothetical protein
MATRYQRDRDSDYPFGIFWPLCCQLFFDIQILITPLVSFGHRVVNAMAKRYQRGNQNLYIEEELTTQWPKDIKGIIRISISKKNWHWLPLWYIMTIVSSALLRYTDSDYPFGIFWPLCCQFLFDIRILITPLVSFGHCVVSSSSTTRWPKDTKGVIRVCISKKNWQHNGQKIPKG